VPVNRDQLAAWDIAETMRECAHTWLTDQTTLGPPDRSFVHVGDVAWDNCECGQLAVTIQEMYPSQSFPMEAGLITAAAGGVTVGNRACAAPLFVVGYLVSIVRCVPSGDGRSPPTPAAPV
jgi:hypothetical protein